MLGIRFKEARALIGVSQIVAAQESGLSQRDISQIENDIKEFIPTQYIQYLNRSGININSLFNQDENVQVNVQPIVQPIDQKSRLSENDLLNGAGEKYISQGNILLVPVKARAGYLAGYGDPEFIETLEYFKIPGCKHGEYRMFEVEGDSMYPTLKHGDYAIGRALSDCCQIKFSTIYIIVCREEGIVIKRILNTPKYKDKIIANSDNENQQLYPPLIIQGTEILECWELYKVISDPPEQEDFLARRLSKLEKEWSEFRKSFKKK